MKEKKNHFIPFAQPEINKNDIQAVQRVLKSGWLTSGPEVAQFESDFHDLLVSYQQSNKVKKKKKSLRKNNKVKDNNNICLAVNSATAGLHLVLEAFGIGPGDEVILPTFTFAATAEVVHHCGAKPIFVDICAETLQMSVDSIIQKISMKTKAIIIVHYGGGAAPIEDIMKIGHERGLFIFEDAAHALPTEYKGELIGNIETDATVFSFYATKTMTTGEGGMIVVRDKKIAERIQIMRLHGINHQVYEREKKKNHWYYEIIDAGFKYNLSDINAALGRSQLSRILRMWEKRQKIAHYYQNALVDLPVQIPQVSEKCTRHSWYLFPILLNPDLNMSRDEFIRNMNDLGIQCSVHFIPLHKHPFWGSKYPLSTEELKNSDDIYERIVSLPIYSTMKKKQVQYIIDKIKQIFKNDS